jgi:nucleoid DNA-binding protein
MTALDEESPAQRGRIDPRTGQPGPALPSRRTVAFKPSSKLRARVARSLDSVDDP